MDIIGSGFEVLGNKEQALQVILQPRSWIITARTSVIYTSPNVKITYNKTSKFCSMERFVLNCRLTNKTEGLEYCCLSSILGGKILAINLQDRSVYVKKEGLLAYSSQIDLENQNNVFYLKGNGMVYLQSPGFLIEKQLGNEETISVRKSDIFCYDAGISVDKSRQIPQECKVIGPGSLLIDPSGEHKIKTERSIYLCNLLAMIPLLALVLIDIF